jgi:hypothetical protein
VIAVPVVASVPVTAWPVSADAYKNILAMIIGIEMPKAYSWAIIVTNRVIISRANNPVAKPPMAISIDVGISAIMIILDNISPFFVSNL